MEIRELRRWRDAAAETRRLLIEHDLLAERNLALHLERVTLLRSISQSAMTFLDGVGQRQ